MSTPMFSRATFLRSAFGLTTAAVGGMVLAAPRRAHAAPVAAEPTRPTPPYVYTLVLDGQVVGTVADVRGGNAYVEMVPDASGTEQLGSTRYRTLDVAVNLSLGQSFYERINSAWFGKSQPMNGSIFRTNAAGGPILERQFTDAVIVGTTFPTLNARASELARMTVSLLPGASSVRPSKDMPVERASSKAMRWTTSNFTLDIDGLDTPGPNGSTTYFNHAVMGIDAFTVALPASTNNPLARNPVRVSSAPRPVEFPTFAVTLQRRPAEPLNQWFDALVVNGDPKARALKPTGRNGVLSWLADDFKTVLARLRLTDIGICELSDGPFDGTEADDLVTAVLYCQRMELDFPKSSKA